MRLRTLFIVLVVVVVVPATGVSAGDGCAPIEGTALVDIANGVGTANVAYDGERLRVPFFTVGFAPTGEFTADIEILFRFPRGDVYVVEHSVSTPKGGPAVEFNSTIDVSDGEGSQWTWSGTANLASGRAAIARWSGDLCLAP